MSQAPLRSNDTIEKVLNPKAHQTKKGFERLGINTVQDLLEFLPFRAEDRTNFQLITQLQFNIESVISGVIAAVSSRRSKRGALIIQATIKDPSGTIQAIWFNQRYLLTILKVGQEITLYGAKQPLKSMRFPFLVKQIIEKAEICPVYRSTNRLSQNAIRKTIAEVLERLPKQNEYLPEFVKNELSLPDRTEAIRSSHQPKKLEDLSVGLHLLATEELFTLALNAENQRRERLKVKRPALQINENDLKEFVSNLPYGLTASQKKATWEILLDLQKSEPMNRILYGEVGSGKTIISLIVARCALLENRSVAILCPTVALAKQQFDTAKKILAKDFRIGLIAGSEKTNPDAPLLIGTHALLKHAEKFNLVIIDEQHRFGVEQRQRISGSQETDVLMMTATPIPRTLASSLLKQLEITYLTERPSHQLPVTTEQFQPTQRKKIEEKIRLLLDAGQPGYVICPRIIEDNSEPADLFQSEKKSVESEQRRLKKVFPNNSIKALHSKLSAEETDKTLESFRQGKTQILVATTVVEVGIDNPLATWMLIEDADYFGLSTLHQLRGRIGRGDQQSYCYVANSNIDAGISQQRLEAFCSITSGLKLAEIDLSLRGPGDIIGTDQSGLTRLKYADWSDTEKIRKVFELAKRVFDEGIEKYPQLCQLLNK